MKISQSTMDVLKNFYGRLISLLLSKKGMRLKLSLR